MRHLSMAAMIVGGALLLAYGPGAVRRARGPAPAAGEPATAEASTPTPALATATATAPSVAATPAAAGGELAAMLAVGRQVRMQPAVPAAVQRRALVEAIDRGPADRRIAALRALALVDRPAADAIARARLADHVLFAEAARLLLTRPDGALDVADVVRVRRALRTGGHGEAERAAIAGLVLETLARRRSPAAPAFAAALRRDRSERVQLVAARVGGGRVR